MKKGEMGVGFLIMIIAIVVIAAIIAGGVLTTTDILGQKSMLTGAAARKKLTNNYLIDFIRGESNEDRLLDRFFMRISLTPGSDPGFMNTTTVSDISPDASAEHWFKQDAECIRDSINGFFLIQSNPLQPRYEAFPDEISMAFDFAPSQTSEFMMGKIIVSIVFPESKGGIDPNTENWDRQTQDALISKVTEVFNWYIEREPRAGLEFAFDIHRDVPTNYEPITRELTEANQELWITQVLDNMDITPGTDVHSRLRKYADDMRMQYNAHWGFTIFMVNNVNDADGAFPGSWSNGVEYRNGPYMVLPVGKSTNVGGLIAHGIGHIFGASDQYVASNCNCTDRSGYLQVRNQNCHNPLTESRCAINESSIMGGDARDTYAYSNGDIDKYARAQMGLIDVNENDILDPVEVHFFGRVLGDQELDDHKFTEYEVAFEGKGFYGLVHPGGHLLEYGVIEPADTVNVCYEPSEYIDEHDYYEVHLVPNKGKHATVKMRMPNVIPKDKNLVVYEAFK